MMTRDNWTALTGPLSQTLGASQEVDPFAGLDLNSPEFMVRKIEILQSELAEANTRVELLEVPVHRKNFTHLEA